MPKGDGTGPAGHGLRDGSDRKAGGRGQQGGQKGQGAKTWGVRKADARNDIYCRDRIRIECGF